jgi:hypothetical protein
LQRGDWRGLADTLRGSASTRSVTTAPAQRAITTVELGAAPLEYYLPGLHTLTPGMSVRVKEIDEIGYSPLRASAGTPPAPGFHLLDRRSIHGLIVYRFVSTISRTVSEATLRRHVITHAHPEVLVPAAAQPSSSAGAQPPSSGKTI